MKSKTVKAILMTLLCLNAGYVFYRWEGTGNLFFTICFTIGILGIMMSVLREKPKGK